MFHLAIVLAMMPQQVTAVSPDHPEDIVVIGRRLKDAEGLLTACLARKCPVDQDIAATLKLANTQFLIGDYKNAHQTLRRSIARNRDEAKTFPVQVASLWRASGTVDSHLGEYDDVRSSELQAYQALRKGLPATDPNVLTGKVDLGDMEFHLGHRQAAEDTYQDAIRSAEKAGNQRIAALARYRLANLIAIRSPRPGSGDEKDVAQVLAPLIGSTDPVLARFDFAARLFKARLAEKRGAKGAVDALFASLPKSVNPAPRLLSSKPVVFATLGVSNCAEDNGQSYFGQVAALSCQSPFYGSNIEVEGQWLDMAFWITPQGGVRDIEVVRRSSRYSGDWAKDVSKSIASRRYSASNAEVASRDYYRVERFTLTAPYVRPTGTRIRTRSPDPVIETADLTPS